MFDDKNKKGAVLFINNQSELYPNTKDAIVIETNSETVIGIKRLFVKKQEYPYSDCVKSKPNGHTSYIYKYIVEVLGKKYQQKDCLDLLIQANSISTCNCTMIFFEKLRMDVKNCETEQEINCGFESFSESGAFVKLNAGLCPLECDSVSYTITKRIAGPLSSNMKFSPEFKKFKTLYNQNTSLQNHDEILRNIAYVRITYSDLSYTQIVEIPKVTVIDLISNIGGTLGLFLGMSLLSFFEIFELLVDLIYFFVNKIISKNESERTRSKEDIAIESVE
jgi:hypothetical protein